MKIKIKEYGKLKEVKILKSDNYEIHIDDIDKNIFKIECIEFKNCSFKDIYFESFEDKRQNAVLLISVSQDNNEMQRNTKPDFKSKTTKENLCYPKLYFEACKFEYFGIKKAEIDYEKNENVSREYINSYAFSMDAIFNYDLHVNACEFDFGFQLLGVQVKSNITFEDITFSKTFKISRSNFSKNIKFKKITFDRVVLKSNSYEEIQMEKVDFKKDILFISNEIIKSAFFKGITVEKIEKDNTVEFYFRCKENSEINFTKCCFYRRINFIGKFDNTTLDIDNGNIFYENVLFKDMKFKNKQILSVNQFKKEVSFFGVKFDDGIEIKDDFLKTKNISFKSCEFNQVIAFENKTIKNLTFGTCIFNKGVYFVFCNFFDVKIYSCSFNHPASFYGSTFNMVPNFSQSTFKDSINLVNIKTNFNFKNLNTTIDNIDKPKYEAANDFRDSFRNFKSALIKDNNFLDASNFHKYELYCKEIELEEKELRVFSKEWIDKWQLVFYRKLCDHHTDLLKVFHNLLIIIMLFSVFYFVLDKFKQPSIENHAKYHIVQVDTNESYIFKEHNKTTYNIFGLNINKESGKLDEFIKNNFVYILILLFIVLLILSFNIFTNLYIFVSFFYVIFNFLDFVALYTHIAIISLFVFFVLKFILLDDKQEIIRKIIIGISYIVCIFALLAKPSLMLPVFGSFLEKDSNATYLLLLSLSVVYFILVALVIFSLQKTARKNSIVPS
ncbi:hypothetical protein [Campylobacter sp. IFREMER_LSEM_CL2194]|uniref:hypothetical protein n=1 Tax=Campylobacter sp. IFREMER_LSEM_CL2194 TaxID=2911621 RepID=UPI0021E80A7E|nr:hypothetical protein [Campylobacter sp. IFREMER_LSEM_CL2194]MCV3376641.1 hypothetical protein [Campylobacter sp. IFREMER_LSEM_CL2194]